MISLQRTLTASLQGRHSVFIVVATCSSSLATLSVLAADATRTAATEGRGECEIDVFLAVDPYQKGWDVADLLAHANVPLADQAACVMDRFREAQLEDLCLQAALHDSCSRQSEHVVELPLVLQEQP